MDPLGNPSSPKIHHTEAEQAIREGEARVRGFGFACVSHSHEKNAWHDHGISFTPLSTSGVTWMMIQCLVLAKPHLQKSGCLEAVFLVLILWLPSWGLAVRVSWAYG